MSRPRAGGCPGYVADHLVHRGAERLRVAAVVERARVASEPDRLGVRDLVERVGREPHPDGLAGDPQDAGRRAGGSAQALELRGGLHVAALSARTARRRVVRTRNVRRHRPARGDLPGLQPRPRRTRRRTGALAARVGVEVALLVLLAAAAPARIVPPGAGARGDADVVHGAVLRETGRTGNERRARPAPRPAPIPVLPAPPRPVPRPCQGFGTSAARRPPRFTRPPPPELALGVRSAQVNRSALECSWRATPPP